MKAKAIAIFDKIQSLEEARLTRKALRQAKEAERDKTAGGKALSWLEAILFAVAVLFFLNLWLVQQFAIPTGSMVPTLPVGSRVIVSKNYYGSELVPSGPKVKSSTPSRGEIITFYNPEYQAHSPLVEAIYNLVELGTAGLVNLNKKSDGTIKEKLFTKRTIGLSGDTVYFRRGNVFIRPAGTRAGQEVSESDWMKIQNLSYHPVRSVNESKYPTLEALFFARLTNHVTEFPERLVDELNGPIDPQTLPDDALFQTQINSQAAFCQDVFDTRYMNDYHKSTLGIWVPEHHVLPCGDNRDNSYDGRYFGPVPTKSINGRVVILAFPFNKAKRV